MEAYRIYIKRCVIILLNVQTYICICLRVCMCVRVPLGLYHDSTGWGFYVAIRVIFLALTSRIVGAILHPY